MADGPGDTVDIEAGLAVGAAGVDHMQQAEGSSTGIRVQGREAVGVGFGGAQACGEGIAGLGAPEALAQGHVAVMGIAAEADQARGTFLGQVRRGHPGFKGEFIRCGDRRVDACGGSARGQDGVGV